MPGLRDKLRAICHSLRMGSYGGIEPVEMEKIRKYIKDLPSPEQISEMKSGELKSLQASTNDILDRIDTASPVRSIGSAIRHHIDKHLPPYRAPVLGGTTNWYKRAAEDYHRLSPSWNVVKIGEDEFQLRYDEFPILDFVLTTRTSGAYDGNIKETKVHGNNYMAKVPKGVRPPMTIEIFSRAKDLLEGDANAHS